jgi:secretion/DNA translocation related CpaE-like protein
MASPPLVITEDVALLDEVLRLTAVAGLEPLVAAAPSRSQWRSACLVLGGDDRTDTAAGLPRRSGAVVVAQRADVSTYEAAMRAGAAEVIELPAGERRLIELLAGTRADPGAGPPGVVWSVLGGCGGAGASVVATALAVCAGQLGEVLLVEADPLGAGLDILLHAEQVPGIRWPDLSAAGSDPLPPPALRDALPRAHGVRVLAVDRRAVPVEGPTPAALGAVLEAARRIAALTVVDVSHSTGRAASTALDDSHQAVVVVPNDVRAVAAASRLTRWAAGHCANLALVVRAESRGLRPTDVAHALALPLAGVLPSGPALTASFHRGEIPGQRPRTPLSRLSVGLLASLDRPAVAPPPLPVGRPVAAATAPPSGVGVGGRS